MNTPRTLAAWARTALPLLAAAALASPADAAVTLIQAGADSSTQVGIGVPSTVKAGPSDRSSDIADPYVISKSDSRDDRYFVTVISSAGSAVQLVGPAKADFFVRSSVNAQAGVAEPQFQFPGHGAASGSAFYEFSVDRQSTLSLSFSAFASPTASVALNLFNIDTHTYLRQGLVTGQDDVSYVVPVGSYGVTLTAFSEGAIPANIAVNTVANSGATANLSLSISPVPEPATWALMLVGIGAVGTTRRRRSTDR
jgi:hypothetical protein